MKITIDVTPGNHSVLDAIVDVFGVPARLVMKPEKDIRVLLTTHMPLKPEIKIIRCVRFQIDGSVELTPLQQKFFDLHEYTAILQPLDASI